MLEDFELMSLMFVDPGVVSQIPLSRTIFHGLGPKPRGTNHKGAQETSEVQDS